MKSEELLYSVSHVGEDLLAAAEQTILVKKRRPWAGAAVAAVLLLAVGVGSFFLWRSRSGGRPVDGSGPAEGSVQSTDAPENTEPNNDYNLPLLSVTGNWNDADEDHGTSLSFGAELPKKRWARIAEQGGELPVYRDFFVENSSRQTQEALEARLRQTAEKLQLSIREGSLEWNLAAKVSTGAGQVDVSVTFPAEAGEQKAQNLFYSVSAATDRGTLTVRYDGVFTLLYDMAHRYTPALTGVVSSASPFEDADSLKTYSEALSSYVLLQLGAGARDYLPLSLTAVHHDPLSSGYSAYVLAPVREDQTQSLLSGQFEQIILLTVDGKTLAGFTCYAPLDDNTFNPTGDCAVPEGLGLIGSYPVVPLATAREYLRQGSYLKKEGTPFPISDDSVILDAELVYLTGGGNELLLPWYRFRLQITEHIIQPIYVPAVFFGYLSDWPNAAPSSAQLPALPLSGQVFPAEPLALSDLAAYLDSNPWQDHIARTLPVYQNRQLSPQGEALPADADTLSYWLLQVAKGLDAKITGELRYLDASGNAASGDQLWSAEAETNLGTLRVWANGSVELWYVKPFSSNSAGFSDDALPAAFGRLTGTKGGFRGDSVGYVRGLYRDPAEGSFEVFPNSPYNDSVLSYCFDRARIYYADGKLLGFRLSGPLMPYSHLWQISYGYDYEPAGAYRSSDPGIPMVLTELGNYPIISAEEAREAAAAGKWYSACTQQPAEDAGEGWLDNMDLVYLPADSNRILLPYYRFLVPLEGGAAGRTLWAQRFVPAVDELFLEENAALQQAEELFSEENGWYCRALLSRYDDPLDADLEQLFYVGIPGAPEVELSEETAARLSELAGYDVAGLNFQYMPGETVDELLQLLFGLDRQSCVQAGKGELSSLLGKNVVYLPENDCYYSFRSDWIGASVQVLASRQSSDGRIALVYESSGRTGTVILLPTDAGFRILSNREGEWNAPMDRLLSELAPEGIDPNDDAGVGIRILRNDETEIAFYGCFGLLDFDAKSGELLYAVDLSKAVDCGGAVSIQGSAIVYAGFGEDGRLLILYTDAESKFPDRDGCLIDPVHGTWLKLRGVPEGFRYEKVEDLNGVGQWGSDGPTLGELWLLHDGERWYPFAPEGKAD